jgi:hypothetical protein
LILRLLALAGFLLTVALALWLTELRPLLVIIVMGVALLVAWTIGWLSWRQEMLRRGAEAVEVDEAPPLLPVPPAAAPPPAFEPVPEAPPPPWPEPATPASIAASVSVLAPPAEAAEAPDPEPPPEPEPVVVPEPAPVAAPAPELAPVEPPPPAPPPPDPAPEPRPVLRQVPTPAPAAPAPTAPSAQPARPEAASAGVVDLRTRVTVQPRRWNLWDLERRARDEAQRDPLRYEEWSYLFVHLRQFATPDGSLPTEFDGLVRESFGDLLEHAG